MSPNFFDPIPNFSTHVLSVDAHQNSSDGNYIRGGHAYGNNSYGGEESSWGTECIENVGIGSDVLVLVVGLQWRATCPGV